MTENSSGEIVTRTVQINAPISRVWDALTNPEIMKKWMSESEIEALTDWKAGNPFIIRGRLHGIKFENYAILEVRVAPVDSGTALTLTASNFATESIYKHMAFYWNVTLEILKRMIEGQGEAFTGAHQQP